MFVHAGFLDGSYHTLWNICSIVPLYVFFALEQAVWGPPLCLSIITQDLVCSATTNFFNWPLLHVPLCIIHYCGKSKELKKIDHSVLIHASCERLIYLLTFFLNERINQILMLNLA